MLVGAAPAIVQVWKHVGSLSPSASAPGQSLNHRAYQQMKLQALVDAKNFLGALDDFDFALKRLPADAQVDRARLLSGALRFCVFYSVFFGRFDWFSLLSDLRCWAPGFQCAAAVPCTPGCIKT